MLLRRNLEVFCTGALPLLAGYQVPGYRRKDGGERDDYREQRYWLSALKVKDASWYQKHEKKKGYYTKVSYFFKKLQ